MITRLDHIAIAVTDMEEGIRRFAEDFGLSLSGTEDVIAAKTSTAFFPIPGTCIELIHPLDGQGAVQQHLDKRGGGLHHVCFETDDIVADMALLKGKGYRLLSETPQPGAHGTLVVFVHPKSTGGILIELAEHPAGADHG
ncbi:MAG: methylmalonyl-CoA/ethylmalonyl-CoA epimerase [Myxococcota bacterium]|jgi:methylmalonyl-CoA/ethylmalonyl-CoA epimerase